MQARWKQFWTDGDAGMKLLGGTPKMDIWCFPSGGRDMRIVWGEDVTQWHWVYPNHTAKRLVFDGIGSASSDLKDVPTKSEMEDEDE